MGSRGQESGEDRASWAARLHEVVGAPLASAALLLLAGGLGLWFHEPWLFPSLGPTAVLQGHRPAERSARLYNTLVGHGLGIMVGYLMVAAFHTTAAPPVLASDTLALSRVGAAVAAVSLTMLLHLVLKASHPPAMATTLLITLGGFGPNAVSVTSLVAGISVVGACGECLRRWRLGGRGEDFTPTPRPVDRRGPHATSAGRAPPRQ